MASSRWAPIRRSACARENWRLALGASSLARVKKSYAFANWPWSYSAAPCWKRAFACSMEAGSSGTLAFVDPSGRTSWVTAALPASRWSWRTFSWSGSSEAVVPVSRRGSPDVEPGARNRA